MLTRRAFVAAFAAVALTPSIAAKPRKAQRRKRKDTPAPAASPLAWRIDTPPLTIPVLWGADPDWTGPVRAAAAAWNGAQPWLRLDVREIASAALDTVPAPGVILVISGLRDEPWGGLTEVAPGDDGILWARITFDDADYAGRYPWPRSTERERVAAHELGHALGLTHAPQGDTGCMATGAIRKPRTRPSGWTLQQLALTYREPLPSEPRKPDKHRRHR